MKEIVRETDFRNHVLEETAFLVGGAFCGSFSLFSSPASPTLP